MSRINAVLNANRISIIILLALIHFNKPIRAQENNLITIGTIDSIYSKSLDEVRKLWIYLPETTQSSFNSKYPALYLLDGDAYFYSLFGIVKQLSSFGTTTCPESIIVAIPNTDRNRDLTPSDPSKEIDNNSGIEAFTSFIEQELIPYIEYKYPALQYRTIIGHSLGGSFVINTLVNNPHVFTNYLAIDPGMKFYDSRVLNNAIKTIRENKSLFLSVANTMPAGMDTVIAIRDTTWVTSTIRSTLTLARSLENSKTNKLNYTWQYYGDENHLSVPTISQYDGLKFFFCWNQLDLDKIIRSNPSISGEEFYHKVIEHYENVSSELGHQVLPSQEQVSDLGYYFFAK